MPFIIFYMLASGLYCFSSIISATGKSKYNSSQISNHVFILLASIIIFLSATRFQTGTDWPSYVDYYFYNDYSWEFLWSLANDFFKSLGFPVESVFFICAIVSLGLKFYRLNFYVDNKLFAVILMIPFIVNKDFGTIRQGLAISIFFFASRYIIDNNPFKYVLSILIASQIHLTAIFLVILYFFGNKRLNVKVALIFLILATAFGYSGMARHIIEISMHLLSFNERIAYKINKYLEYQDEFQNIYNVYGIDVGSLKKWITLAIFFALGGGQSSLLNSSKYNFCFNMLILGNAVFFAFPDIEQFRRIVGYFDLFQICCFLMFLKSLKDIYSRTLFSFYLWLTTLVSLYGYINTYHDYVGSYKSLLGFVL